MDFFITVIIIVIVIVLILAALYFYSPATPASVPTPAPPAATPASSPNVTTAAVIQVPATTTTPAMTIPTPIQPGNGCLPTINGGVCNDMTNVPGTCKVVSQSDGNIVIYNIRDPNNIKPIWSSNTANKAGFKAPYKFVIQTDGNLVSYDANNMVNWAANTENMGITRASLGDDCNFVLYDANNNGKWQTDTRG